MGRFSETSAHSATNQWQTKTDTLALSFWNSAIITIGTPSTNHWHPINKPEFDYGSGADGRSLLTLGVWNVPRYAGRCGTRLAETKDFVQHIDLVLSYLQSDQVMSATPSGNKQSHNQRGRISRIPVGQPCSAATRTAQMRDTDGRGGNKESTPQGPGQSWNFCRDSAQSSQAVPGDVATLDFPGRLPQPGPAIKDDQAGPKREQIRQQGANLAGVGSQLQHREGAYILVL